MRVVLESMLGSGEEKALDLGIKHKRGWIGWQGRGSFGTSQVAFVSLKIFVSFLTFHQPRSTVIFLLMLSSTIGPVFGLRLDLP